MWIMLTRKLPTQVSPPKLSIFWAEERPDIERAGVQFDKYNEEYELDGGDLDFNKDEKGNKLNSYSLLSKKAACLKICPELYFVDGWFGHDPNVMKKVSILYKECELGVWPNEYSILTHENMTEYITHSHELVPSIVAGASGEIGEVFEGAIKEIYDAARVDGADQGVAMAMAFGIDISERDIPITGLANFPKVGWYRCLPVYAKHYCDPEEMKE